MLHHTVQVNKRMKWEFSSWKKSLLFNRIFPFFQTHFDVKYVSSGESIFFNLKIKKNASK